MVACVTLLIFTFIILSNALETTKDNEANVNIILNKFYNKIPDVDSKYVINEGLSKLIKSYFNGKVNAFPLFKINVKLDGTPVKIPWTLDQAEPPNEKLVKKRYKYLKHKPITENKSK